MDFGQGDAKILAVGKGSVLGKMREIEKKKRYVNGPS
jgi:hypothetical protein